MYFKLNLLMWITGAYMYVISIQLPSTLLYLSLPLKEPLCFDKNQFLRSKLWKRKPENKKKLFWAFKQLIKAFKLKKYNQKKKQFDCVNISSFSSPVLLRESYILQRAASWLSWLNHHNWLRSRRESNNTRLTSLTIIKYIHKLVL